MLNENNENAFKKIPNNNKKANYEPMNAYGIIQSKWI